MASELFHRRNANAFAALSAAEAEELSDAMLAVHMQTALLGDSSDSDGGSESDDDESDSDSSADGGSRLPWALRNVPVLVSWTSLAAVFALQPPGRRIPPTLDLAITTAAFALEYNLLVFPLLAQLLSGLLRACACVAPRCARAVAKLAAQLGLTRALHLAGRALVSMQRMSLEGVASVGLVIILVLPLLSGTPVPITVLMENQWAPAYAAGDVLLVSGKAVLAPGAFAMYRDAASAASLRAGNVSTCMGQLLALRCGEGGAEPCALRGGLDYITARGGGGPNAPSHAMLLRRARKEGAPGAPPVPCLAEHATAPGWECTLVPASMLLGAVGVRVPRAAWPAVPLFSARRAALAARPPRLRLVPHLAEAARAAGWAALADGEAGAADGACEVARAAAEAAKTQAASAPFWRRAAAVEAAAAAAQALTAPGGACAVQDSRAQPASAAWGRLAWQKQTA